MAGGTSGSERRVPCAHLSRDRRGRAGVRVSAHCRAERVRLQCAHAGARTCARSPPRLLLAGRLLPDVPRRRPAGPGHRGRLGRPAERRSRPARCCRCRSPLGPGAATEATVRVVGRHRRRTAGRLRAEHRRPPSLLPLRRRHHPGLRRRRASAAEELDVEVRAGPASGPLTVTVSDGGVAHAGPGPRGGRRAAGHPAPAAAALQPGLPQRRRRRPAPRARASGTRAARPTPPARPTSGRSTRSSTTGSGSSPTRSGRRRPGRRPLGSRLAPHRQLRPGRQPHAARRRRPGWRPRRTTRSTSQRFRAHHLDLYPAARRPRVRRQPVGRLQAAARAGVPGGVRALLHAHPVRAAAVPRPSRRAARRHGVRLPAGAGRPGGHHRPVRHRARTTRGSGSTASSCGGSRGC